VIQPIALRVEGRRVLVVGAGRVGASRAHQLVRAGARVTVVATEILAPLPIEAVVHRRRYRRRDAKRALLVVAATGDERVNDRIVRDVERRQGLINVVDDPKRCSAYFMAQCERGDVTVAVSTRGSSPWLAGHVRDLVEAALPDDLADLAAALGERRRQLHAAGESTEGLDWSAIVEEWRRSRRVTR
jgi:siroheme synthase-like protein